MSDSTLPTAQAILNKASTNKFRMVLNVPPILQNINTHNPSDRTGNTIDLNTLQFSVYGTVVPASYVPHEEVRFGGQTAKVTSYSRPSYPNININFVIDNKFKNYFVMWKWLQLLNDEKKSYYNVKEYTVLSKIPEFAQYMTDLTVFGKDEYDKDVVKFTYTNSFITRLEGIEYSNQNPDQIESKFEFAFGQFYMDLL